MNKKMRKTILFRNLSFGLFAITTIVLITATIIEKTNGTQFVLEQIYTAEWMITLWGVAALSALVYIIMRKMQKEPATLCLHISFIVILAGALVTHLCSKQGSVHLRKDSPVKEYRLTNGSTEGFPFSVTLKSFSKILYKGTTAPMDFVCDITIEDKENIEGVISMNNIFKYRGFRFYQAGYDTDGNGTTLNISYDPWGIGVTYTGYIFLLLSMFLFFFQKKSGFKTAIRKAKGVGNRKAITIALLLTVSFATAKEKPATLPQEVAEKFCDMYVCHNDRICPLQTLAIEFTLKIYGKDEYEGYSAEQVLTGWFFFYDDWKSEPMIKIKGNEVKRVLGIEGDYARLTDFVDRNGYKLQQAGLYGTPEKKDFAAADEKFNIISMLCTGSLLKLYPNKESETGNILWYSFADRLPQEMKYEKWLFINKSMNLVAERIAMSDYDSVVEMLGKIREYQIQEGGESVPSATRFEAEKIYNRINNSLFPAILCLITGILGFIFGIAHKKEGIACTATNRILLLVAGCVFLYISSIALLRWYIGGHLPLSNGHETMIFMAWCSIVLTLVFCKKERRIIPFGHIICGLTLLVATMSEKTPQITPLMPVLQSPLLCIHVVTIMLSYTLFAFTMFNGVAALVLKSTSKNRENEIIELQAISRIMLYPAVFLLAAGIFIGAVWANVSWGRYWGWDPKEVWALITLFIYAAAFHSSSIKAFKRPIFFHTYCIAAFLSVIITYFGVNFILGGMHSYA